MLENNYGTNCKIIIEVSSLNNYNTQGCIQDFSTKGVRGQEKSVPQNSNLDYNESIMSLQGMSTVLGGTPVVIPLESYGAV